MPIDYGILSNRNDSHCKEYFKTLGRPITPVSAKRASQPRITKGRCSCNGCHLEKVKETRTKEENEKEYKLRAIDHSDGIGWLSPSHNTRQETDDHDVKEREEYERKQEEGLDEEVEKEGKADSWEGEGREGWGIGRGGKGGGQERRDEGSINDRTTRERRSLLWKVCEKWPPCTIHTREVGRKEEEEEGTKVPWA